jgi:hypothetical protein
MYEPLHLADVERAVLAHDRIAELHAIAAETRAPRRASVTQSGLLMRTRLTLSRRLISIGSTVAGHHA